MVTQMNTHYLVTGVLTNGRRFPAMRFEDRCWAMLINLWRGSVWEVTDGKRKLIRRVWNQ